MTSIKNFLSEINKVYDCNLTKIRIGNKHDGGYIALQELCEKTNTVYSIGIGNDVSFELDFVQRFPKTKIKLFDPTISGLPVEHKNFEFFRSGFNDFWNIQNDSILKIDIEWNEWELLKLFDMVCATTLFSQILIEIHAYHVEAPKGLSPYFTKVYQDVVDKTNNALFADYYRWIRKLNTRFYIFHIHPNNSLSRVTLGGYTFPPLIELSLVRKNLVGSACNTIGNFPVPGLDFPNKTDRKDILEFYPLGGVC